MLNNLSGGMRLVMRSKEIKDEKQFFSGNLWKAHANGYTIFRLEFMGANASRITAFFPERIDRSCLSVQMKHAPSPKCFESA